MLKSLVRIANSRLMKVGEWAKVMTAITPPK
jgi:hypothetical protein